MSWSVTLEVVRDVDAEPQVSVKHRQSQVGHGDIESEKAIESAVDAVKGLLRNMALGYGTFDVQLSGHANPENKPVAGWSNDFMSIRISQVKRLPVA